MNGLQIWIVAANVLSKHSREGDKGWSSSLGFDARLTTPHRKNLRRYETFYKTSSRSYSVNIHFKKKVKVKLRAGHEGVWAAAGITPNIFNLYTGRRSILTSSLGGFFPQEIFRGARETVWPPPFFFFFWKKGSITDLCRLTNHYWQATIMSVLLLLVFVTLETDMMTLYHRCHQHQICFQPHLRFLHVLLYVGFLLFKAFPPYR